MDKLNRLFRTKSIGFIIIISFVSVVLMLMLSIVLATFASFRQNSREAISIQTRELSSQIVYNYDNYIATVIRTSNIVQADADFYNFDNPSEALEFSAYLNGILRQREDILNIALYEASTGRCLSSTDQGEIGQRWSPVVSAQWFYEAVSDPTVHAFSVPYEAVESGNYKVNVSKEFKLQNSGERVVLMLGISFQNFIELVEHSNLGANGHITIIDSEYGIVYTSLEQISSQEIDVIKAITLGSMDMSVGDHRMAVSVDTLSNTKWRICVFTNIDELVRIERTFLLTMFGVSSAILLVGSFLFVWVTKIITDPLKQLELTMRKVEHADYFRREVVELHGTEDVEVLARRFNRMMEKINELVKRVVSEQNAKRRSELRALQNQINPHFLYNTLDSIVWLIENDKNQEAGKMVVALARLFRIGVSMDQEVISVREEIEHVRNYLLIQNIRYADSFDYTFDVEEGVLDCATMKLVLQPLVENSIYHGLKNKIDHGHIGISAKEKDGYLLLSVSDDGYGMRQSVIDALYASFADSDAGEGVGLKNVYQRVRMYYGGEADMVIKSELDEGTTITIKEPLKKK